MDLSSDKKSGILLDMLHDLMAEMKSGAGEKWKPKKAEVEEVVSKPESASEEAAGDELDNDLLTKLAADGHDRDEDKGTSMGAASRRLAKRVAASKMAC